MTAPQHPVDHVRPLPASVVGRGKDEITQAQVDALYPWERIWRDASEALLDGEPAS